MNKLGVLWFSHKKCSVEELEAVAPRLTPTLFSEDPRVLGYVIIKTCNRVETYISAENAGEILEEVVDRQKLEKGGIFSGEDALWHLMRVACGLEAMIVGEDQILGQIKKSYLDSKKAGTLDDLLDLSFDRAIKVAKRARRETRINEGSVSIGSAAVDLAESITEGLKGKSILVIGAGEMGTRVAKAISEKNLRAMFIANRTYERAKVLASEVGGKAAKLDENEKWLSCCDVCICTTSAPHYVLDYGLMTRVMGHRITGNKLFIIDIANPKDVEERVGDIEGVGLYDLDCLYEISEENKKKRLSEVEKVEMIIDKEVDRFKKILNRQRIERLIGMIYEHGSHVREEEKRRALRFIEKGKDPKVVLDKFSHALLNKTLHLQSQVFRDFVVKKEDYADVCHGDGDNCAFVDFFMDEIEKRLCNNVSSNKSGTSSKAQ